MCLRVAIVHVEVFIHRWLSTQVLRCIVISIYTVNTFLWFKFERFQDYRILFWVKTYNIWYNHFILMCRNTDNFVLVIILVHVYILFQTKLDPTPKLLVKVDVDTGEVYRDKNGYCVKVGFSKCWMLGNLWIHTWKIMSHFHKQVCCWYFLL